MVSNKVHLPTYEELTVEEVPLTTAYLRAGAVHLGKYCENANNEFMLCRKETGDIRACINEGKEVTSCSLEFFRKVKKSCFQEFQDYAHCIDFSSASFDLEPCRKTQAVLDFCMQKNFGIERPDVGYFCRVKVHDTKRPKPEPTAPQIFEDTPKELPKIEVKGQAKYGTRFNWIE